MIAKHTTEIDSHLIASPLRFLLKILQDRIQVKTEDASCVEFFRLWKMLCEFCAWYG
jgi:hypothetical protein